MKVGAKANKNQAIGRPEQEEEHESANPMQEHSKRERRAPAAKRMHRQRRRRAHQRKSAARRRHRQRRRRTHRRTSESRNAVGCEQTLQAGCEYVPYSRLHKALRQAARRLLTQSRRGRESQICIGIRTRGSKVDVTSCKFASAFLHAAARSASRFANLHPYSCIRQQLHNVKKRQDELETHWPVSFQLRPGDKHMGKR